MTASRVEITEAALDRAILGARPAGERLRGGLYRGTALALFADMARSRALDVLARRLRAAGEGFYTISSAGHEHNAIVGARLRTTDPAFLHYRSGGFVLARARQDPAVDAVRDIALSLAASADDPIAQGRHKVWGSRPLWIPPQTSTIASHIPKATGAAFALERARRVGLALEIPPDSIVCCSFGDASANHATALAGINAARYAHRRGSATPILFVCEDNGLGISVETPRRWIADTFSGMRHLRYVPAGGEIDEVWEAVGDAVQACRRLRMPVFLHLETVRLWGHAGSDVEAAYRTLQDIEADEARDPLPAAARRLVACGVATPDELAAIVAQARADATAAGEEATRRPKLRTRADVVAPLAPYDPAAVWAEVDAAAGGQRPERETAPSRRTMAAHLNRALADELGGRPELLVFGEDVGHKGGVYHVTAGLKERFGQERVFDTLLDETTILGVAQGAALLGFLPVCEIQYLAYVHNALDQLRGEAASLSFFSSGRFRNPMVVRLPGLAYQKGFGGHFHNDNAIGALRDIPGLALAVPARGDEAARLLRGAIAMAKACGRVVCLLEPIALYHEKDLHSAGDEGWLSDYPAPGSALLPGQVGLYDQGAKDLLMVSYANGLRMSLRVVRRLREEHGVRARVLDLRWLNPLPMEAVRAHAEACGRLLVVDECRATGGGIADAVIAGLVESGFRGPAASVRAVDTYVPLGPAADLVLVGEAEIESAALELVK